MQDSLFADVSEFQRVVDDSYPYQIFSFRSNDGTYQDKNFYRNWQWATAAANSGKLACFIVYFYWRPNWLDTVNTHKGLVGAAGGMHPKMLSMIDTERGGNPQGDFSDALNRTYWNLTDWYGTSQRTSGRRVLGYANRGDDMSMWSQQPEGLLMVGAGYGQDPALPGEVAHQYTDGTGLGGGLPEGASPFGSCDMNSADGRTPDQFAQVNGIGGPLMALTDAEQQELLESVRYIKGQLGPWSQLGTNDKGQPLTLVDGVASIGHTVNAPGMAVPSGADGV